MKTGTAALASLFFCGIALAAFAQTSNQPIKITLNEDKVGSEPVTFLPMVGDWAVVQDSGALGPNKERQEAPHAHWIEPSAHNRFVYVADLGLDRVLIYNFDAARGTLTPGASSAEPSWK